MDKRLPKVLGPGDSLGRSDRRVVYTKSASEPLSGLTADLLIVLIAMAYSDGRVLCKLIASLNKLRSPCGVIMLMSCPFRSKPSKSTSKSDFNSPASRMVVVD